MYKKRQKLKWPLDKETQLEFKQFAREGYQYESLTELIPEYDSTKVCKHGNKFSPGCPKKKFWIQSRNVKIYNTEYLAEKPRTAYFRPTENNLSSCKDYWNGDDHLLLKVSKDKVGYQVQIVSINLLLEYSWIFTKLGGSERRFLASHNNRMRFQYGVELHHLLPWYI